MTHYEKSFDQGGGRRAKGYEISILPRNLEKDEEEQRNRVKTEKMISDIKEVVYGFAEDQLQAGIEYLKDSENRKKLIDFGKKVAGVVIRRD